MKIKLFLESIISNMIKQRLTWVGNSLTSISKKAIAAVKVNSVRDVNMRVPNQTKLKVKKIGTRPKNMKNQIWLLE